MTPKQLESRCIKLFGPKLWVYELAHNLKCSRQNVERIMKGYHGIKPYIIEMLGAWESGKLPWSRRPVQAKGGRKFTCVAKKARGKH